MAQRKKARMSKRQRRKRRMRRVAGLCLILGIIAAAALVVLKMGPHGFSVAAIRLERERVPQSLSDLMERNPEAKQFVLDYGKERESAGEIDLSGEVEQGKIPLFIQWDERWGYETYGDDFLALTGCGPTCLSMVRCGLGGDTQWNPYQVAQMAQEQGFYVEGNGSSWELMTLGAQQIGLTEEDVTFDADHIRERLRDGCPIICAMGPGDFTTSGHFIVLAGVDEDGKIIVHDPNSRKNSEKLWDVEDLMRQMKNLWGYRM